ncbi:MAG: molybdopterin-binding oxidoreductase [Proteobacteria bacterium]|nr:molybdopterin-binding oxidoreductase [Pseudomonadota bacterium]
MSHLRCRLQRGQVVAVLALACASFGASAAAVSTQFTVSGAVATPLTFDTAALQALPAVTQTDTFISGSGTQTHTYVGAALWNVVGQAGVVTNPAIKNDALNRIVVATGTDGYRVVYSMGELSPNFGNSQALAAYAEVIGGSAQPLAGDGFARSTAPLDSRGGRYVSNLVNLDVQHTASTAAAGAGGTSTQFSVSGDVLNAMSFDLAALQALSLPTITRTFGSDTYSGVSLWGLLSAIVGLDIDAAVKNDVLGMYVVATGSDGYQVAYSLGELSAQFGNQPDFIAFDLNGNALTTSGFARLIVPNDSARGRWVSNLVSLEVFHAAAAATVPLPATAALALAGLLLLPAARRFRPRAARPS